MLALLFAAVWASGPAGVGTRLADRQAVALTVNGGDAMTDPATAPRPERRTAADAAALWASPVGIAAAPPAVLEPDSFRAAGRPRPSADAPPRAPPAG